MAEQQATAAAAEDDDFEIVETPDGAPPPKEEKAPAADNDDDADDEDARGHEDGEGEEGEEEGDERAHIRERRREERKMRKEQRLERERRAKLLISSQQKVIDELNSRLQAVEQRTSGSEVAQIDTAIKEAQAEIARAQAAIQEAFKTGNGELHVQAQQHWYGYTKRLEELNAYKQNLTTRSSQPSPVQLDHQTRANAESWMKDHPWYDPQGKDLDSGIVLRIDAALASEGFDARTPEYWEELEARVGRYLPHRSAKAPQQPAARPRQAGSAQAGGSGREGSSAAGGKRQVHLSPARIQAIKDAGAWEDVGARNRMIKAYMDFDKQNRS